MALRVEAAGLPRVGVERNFGPCVKRHGEIERGQGHMRGPAGPGDGQQGMFAAGPQTAHGARSPPTQTIREQPFPARAGVTRGNAADLRAENQRINSRHVPPMLGFHRAKPPYGDKSAPNRTVGPTVSAPPGRMFEDAAEQD
ncbi:hypothetical protein Acy02nite_38730 [Actinoplanes cyaneus]|uniref:Uncharacterized protein n=1 Tax=Actinoplanes cyaneus TaxID=52696 RepID=A0A919M4U6_9ACTN|nr:hypothetical protein Acy02nite_38730 [Actinoplanes cyaneus]